MLDALDVKINQYDWTTVHTSTDLPNGGRAFALVVCSSVCSFLDDYPSTVEVLVSRLAPGGLFVQWDWEPTGDDEHGLARHQIRHTLTATGLAAIAVHTGFTIEVNGQAMSPLMGHGRRPHHEPES